MVSMKIDPHVLKGVVFSSSLRVFTLIPGMNAGVFSLRINLEERFLAEKLFPKKNASPKTRNTTKYMLNKFSDNKIKDRIPRIFKIGL